jgi:hypothetical protein
MRPSRGQRFCFCFQKRNARIPQGPIYILKRPAVAFNLSRPPKGAGGQGDVPQPRTWSRRPSPKGRPQPVWKEVSINSRHPFSVTLLTDSTRINILSHTSSSGPARPATRLMLDLASSLCLGCNQVRVQVKGKGIVCYRSKSWVRFKNTDPAGFSTSLKMLHGYFC